MYLQDDGVWTECDTKPDGIRECNPTDTEKVWVHTCSMHQSMYDSRTTPDVPSLDTDIIFAAMEDVGDGKVESNYHGVKATQYIGRIENLRKPSLLCTNQINKEASKEWSIYLETDGKYRAYGADDVQLDLTTYSLKSEIESRLASLGMSQVYDQIESPIDHPWRRTRESAFLFRNDPELAYSDETKSFISAASSMRRA